MSGWTANDRDLLAAAGIAPDDEPMPFDARAAEAMIEVHRANELRLRAEVRILKVAVIGLLGAIALVLAVFIAKGNA